MATATATPLTEGVKVKTEKPDDDAEIMELAAKMIADNKMKMAQSAAQANQPVRTLNGASNLRGYIVSSTVNGSVLKTAPAAATPTTPSATGSNQEVPIDDASRKGRWIWGVIGSVSVPVLSRRDGRYISVRIMEERILSKHLNYLHPDIYLQARVPSYEMTEAEIKLMNEINIRHVDYKYGRNSFSSLDLVVRFSDAVDFFTFLDVCFHKLQAGTSNYGSDKCGFIRINEDSVIPYTCKDGEKYVPIFYFEGETDKLKTKSVELSGWELSYLKFCCKVQGIKNELFNNETCAVTSLNDIKSYFSVTDKFEEYWPTKVVDSQLLISNAKQTGAVSSNSWIRAPPPGAHPRAGARPLSVQQTAGVISVNGRGGVAGAPGSASAVAVNRTSATLQNNYQQQLVAARLAAVSNNRQNVAAVVSRANGLPQYYANAQMVSNGVPNGGTVPPLVRPQMNGVPGGNSAAYSRAGSNAYNSITPNTYKAAWPNGYTPGTATPQQLQQMIAASQMPVTYPGYATGAKQSNEPMQARAPVPPPLIPVGSSAVSRSLRYQSLVPPSSNSQVPSKNSSSSAEIIDLSSPPNSPKRSASSGGNGNSVPQHRSSSGVGGSLGGLSSRDNLSSTHAPSFLNQAQKILLARYDRDLVEQFNYIDEVATSGATKPYRITRVKIENGTVPCINSKPFTYNDGLIITISDFIQTFFPTTPVKRVLEAFNVLGTKLYVANRLQLYALNETKKYKDIYAILPLISVLDLKEHMGAIKYILNPCQSTTDIAPPKRQKIS